jgi:23S rRNA pseudouridine2605 synthase
VRRVLESIGLKVNRLIRLAYGPLALGTLLPGEIEEVGPRVLREQFADHIAPANLPKGDRPAFGKAATIADARAGGGRREAGGEPGAGASAKPAAPKKVYKAGWAKAKPPKPGGMRTPRKGKPAVKRSAGPSPRARGEDR